MVTRFTNIGELILVCQCAINAKVFLDLLRMNDYSDILSGTTFLGPETERDLLIYWPNCCHRNAENTFKVKVRDIATTTQTSRTPLETFQVISAISFKHTQHCVYPDFPSMILDNSMPSLTELESCQSDSHHSCEGGPLDGLHRAFGKFYHDYCALPKNLPLVSE